MGKYIFLLLSFAAFASANPILLFDRGLPTTNLNNAAGANRSNVAWADGDINIVYGDDFNLMTSGLFNISDLRVWIVSSADQISDRWSSLTLYSGNSAPITAVSTVSTSGGDPNVTITPATYAGGEQYQSQGGSLINMWQVDFLNLNWTVDGNTTYDFFLGGAGWSTNPFLHASNASLSGSTQQGADNKLLYYDFNSPGIVVWDSNGNGWDKSSDINVQLFGEAIPEPSSFALVITGLFGVLGGRARKRKRA